MDAVLDALADIPTVGLDDQVGRYTQAHDALRRILQSIDGDGGTPR